MNGKQWTGGLAAALLVGFVACSVIRADDELAEAKKQMRNLNAVQVVYRDQVPQVDKNGQMLKQYDPKRSFFPIGVWTPNHGEKFGYHYDWKQIKEGGFNTVWVWPANPPGPSLDLAKEFGLQAIVGWGLSEQQLLKIKDHPSLLANVYTDEPIGKLGSADMDKKFQAYRDYLERVQRVAPKLSVFVNDAPWFTAPATEWWVKWNTAGAICCNDNYPIQAHKHSARTLAPEPQGLPQTVSLQVAVNHSQKPVWLIVGNFEEPRPNSPFPFRFPTPMQLRAQVYAAVIHGATGIHYFAMDSYITRDALVIGMSPDPQVVIPPDPSQRGAMRRQTPAKPMQLVQSRAAWDAACRVNRELQQLAPTILSPTAGQDVKYQVEIEGESVSESPIRCLLKRSPDGKLVLLSVNLDDAVLEATYRFAGELKSAHPLFENQPPLALEKDLQSVKVHYEPFEVHVLELQAGK